MLFLIGEELCTSLFLLSLPSVFPPAAGSALNTAAGPAFFPLAALSCGDKATEGREVLAAVLIAASTLGYWGKMLTENQGKA